MITNAVSSANHQAPLQQSSAAAASAPARVKDNDGDYDNGTGADDAVKTKALQAAAQPHLGKNVNIQA